MNILLSIKPKYVKLIFSGKKTYEYRRKLWKERGIEKYLVYSSSPVCKVVGEFVNNIIWEGDVNSLWRLTTHSISEADFFNYFKGVDRGYAVGIQNPVLYDEPKDIKEFGVKPPQSFCYIRGTNGK